MKNNKRPIIYILLSSLLFILFCGFGNLIVSELFPTESALSGGLSTTHPAAKIFSFPFQRVSAADVNEETTVIPGGNSFGVKIYADGLIAVGFAEIEEADGSRTPALDAGMKLHDVITKVDGEGVTTAEDFVKYVENCEGKDIVLEFRRDNKQMKAVLHPVKSGKDGKYRIGMWLRDSTAGIGTVTYVIPETLCFGGLGHGICDGASGELVPLSHGSIADVTINSVNRGMSGTPGELKGSFSSGKRGSLISNTKNGVFGVYSSLPESLEGREPVPIGSREVICEGEAKIYCTLGDDGICEYSVRISDINKEDTSSKSFIITVTDPALIERTGGIVQGMSGSPVIQDGKLVGAVTHVFVSDPTRGYGIFAENMLETAQGAAEQE